MLVVACHVEMTHGSLLSHVDSKLMTLCHCQSCYAQVHFHMTPLFMITYSKESITICLMVLYQAHALFVEPLLGANISETFVTP